MAEYVKPDVDYEGQTFTIGALDLDLSYAITKYHLISHEEESGDAINDAIIKMTRQVEEELNIKLELMDIGGVPERNQIDNITRPIYAGEDVMQAVFPLTVGLAKLLAVPSLLTDINSISTMDL